MKVSGNISYVFFFFLKTESKVLRGGVDVHWEGVATLLVYSGLDWWPVIISTIVKLAQTTREIMVSMSTSSCVGHSGHCEVLAIIIYDLTLHLSGPRYPLVFLPTILIYHLYWHDMLIAQTSRGLILLVTNSLLFTVVHS